MPEAEFEAVATLVLASATGLPTRWHVGQITAIGSTYGEDDWCRRVVWTSGRYRESEAAALADARAELTEWLQAFGRLPKQTTLLDLLGDEWSDVA